MDLLNICVIGCGDIFNISHIEHWEKNPHSRIYSVVDIDPAVARAAADQVGAETWYTDYEEALADPAVDAVDIALPHQLHRPATEAACAAGVPILCEKPMAMTVADGEAMIAAAARAGVPLSIRHTLRYDPVYQEMKRQIRAGAIGDPLFGSMRTGGLIPCERLAGLPYWHWFKNRAAGGGTIAGVGIHGVDVLLWLVEGTVKAAYGVGGRRMMDAGFPGDADNDVEDTASLSIALEGGAVLNVIACWTLRGPRPPAQVHGSEGALFALDDGLLLVAADGTETRLEVPAVERTITDDFVDYVLAQGSIAEGNATATQESPPASESPSGVALPAPAHEVIESVKVLEACYGTIDPLLR